MCLCVFWKSRTDIQWKDLGKTKVHPAMLGNRVEGHELGNDWRWGRWGSKGACHT